MEKFGNKKQTRYEMLPNCMSNSALLQHLPHIHFYAKATVCGTEISAKQTRN